MAVRWFSRNEQAYSPLSVGDELDPESETYLVEHGNDKLSVKLGAWFQTTQYAPSIANPVIGFEPADVDEMLHELKKAPADAMAQAKAGLITVSSEHMRKARAELPSVVETLGKLITAQERNAPEMVMELAHADFQGAVERYRTALTPNA